MTGAAAAPRAVGKVLPPYARPGPPEERLRALLAAIHALAAALGRAQLVADLPAEVGVGDTAARVVVAGETTRGKSSLVNALVGRPGLSPVGAEVTTACWVALRAGTPERAEAVLASSDDMGRPALVRQSVPLTDVADLVSVEGRLRRAVSADRLGGQDGEVVGVDVVLDAPLLDGVVLVDTPGVGGLTRGHGEVTLQALASADALLFVLDGTTPVLRPEVEFLAAAVQRVGHVVVALTKSDAQPAELTAVLLEETRANLSRRAPGLAGVRLVPVSARRAELATRLGADRSEAAEHLRRMSGLAELADWLTGTVRGRAEHLRRLVVARAARSALASLRTAEQGTAGAVLQRPQRAHELGEQERRLRAHLDDRAPLSVDVAHALQRMNYDPRRGFDEDVRRLREVFRERAVSGPAEDLDRLPVDLQSELGAAAGRRVHELGDIAATLARDLAERLGTADAVPGVLERAGGGLDWDLAGPGSQVRAAGQTAFGVLGMSGLGFLAANLMSAGWALAVTLPAAAGLGWWRARAGEQQQRRVHLAQWVTTTCAESRGLFAAFVEDRVVAVRQYTDVSLPRLLAERADQVKAVRAELAALERAGRAAEQAAAAESGQRLLAIDQLLRAADDLVEVLLSAEPPV